MNTEVTKVAHVDARYPWSNQWTLMPTSDLTPNTKVATADAVVRCKDVFRGDGKFCPVEWRYVR